MEFVSSWNSQISFKMEPIVSVSYSKTLHDHLEEIGFEQCDFDVGLYKRWKDGKVVYITVYVDDLLIAGKMNDIESVIEELSQKFPFKNLGRVKHILSMEVHIIPGEVLCISLMLERFGLNVAHAVGSPLMQNENLPAIEIDEEKINDLDIPFRELIGALQYLVSCTRSDLANAVRSVARYSSAYAKENYDCTKRILRYLTGSRTHGLVYRREGEVLQRSEERGVRYSSAYAKENYDCAKRILRYLTGSRTHGLVYRREGEVLPL
ncbi:polyprotein [Phytophthora megakarya]|uniref:Polyprotein n=1 Tax=Phytophthora megakarya TaxID=4795 RepID=A0A225VZT3_9STRA|nr:polyprotein [Phytophthora megakarya]